MNTTPRNNATRPGGADRVVVEATLDSIARGIAATLVMVVETVGSTYARVGAMALFGPDSMRAGWLSGGCLEAEIAQRAQRVADTRCLEWMNIDTRDDDDLFSGSATGCRGRLRLALLPLAALDRWYTVALAWLERRGPLSLTIAADGSVEACIGATRIKWQLAGSSLDPTDAGLADRVWSLDLPPPPAVVIFGAGPETALLIPLLRTTGWMTTVVERRERWTAVAQLADRVLNDTPTAALRQIEGVAFDAAVVMHHNFELDREALVELARQPIAFVGLLGPKRRCDDLFSVMPARLHEALAPRLHSPVGLDIGGQGAEAIALSIAAQLHAWRHAK